MKQIKIILLIIFVQLASCQSKKETGFVLEKKKLYYNSKEIALGMPIEKFTDAMGMYDRIDIDSSGGFTSKRWLWNKENYDAFYIEEEKKYKLYLSNEESVKYNSMEEIISKYGKYDSIEEIKSPLNIDKLFIWDELGISLSAYPETNIVGNIHIQTLHITKYWELDLGLVKTIGEKSGLPLDKEELERRKIDKGHLEEAPKKEYTGNFTYNSNTINIKEIGNTGWKKAIKGLGIEGSSYDPPGDSSTFSRWIKDDYDMFVTFERFSNMDDYTWKEPSKEDVGDLDCIKSIVIWWHRTDDEK